MEPIQEKVPSGRRKWLFLCVIAAVALLLGSFSYWYHVLRGELSTDDAYVAGNVIPVMSQVSGHAITITRTDTEWVEQGDVLVLLDDTDARLSYWKSRGHLATAVRQVRRLSLLDLQYQANVQQAEIAYDRASEDYQRLQRLAGESLLARQALEHGQDAVASSKAALTEAREQFRANKALVLDTPLRQQPQITQAADAVREAWLMLQRTAIRSPVSGYIARRNVQPGQVVAPGQTLMSVVPATQMWVNANFKETQLHHVKRGLRATIVSDFYGDRVIYKGRVSGITMGTGGAFSLLPAQNASGNWIKVVQRVPVRIDIDPQMLVRHPLRIGLSTTTTIHLEPDDASAQSEIQPALKTEAPVPDLQPVNAEIEQIIRQNEGAP